MIGAKDVAEINECPACASLNIVQNTQREQVVCKDCGLIFQPTPLLEGTATKLPTKKKKNLAKQSLAGHRKGAVTKKKR